MPELFIPINEDTLELIAEVNGGLKPKITATPQLFVYRGPDTTGDIIDTPEKLSDYSDAYWHLAVKY